MSSVTSGESNASVIGSYSGRLVDTSLLEEDGGSEEVYEADMIPVGRTIINSSIVSMPSSGGINVGGISSAGLTTCSVTTPHLTPSSSSANMASQLQFKRLRRLHSYEANPSMRKRQQGRLLRKLRALMEEYVVRVGQQAVLVCCASNKTKPTAQKPTTQSKQTYRVFGSEPLETVIRNHRERITESLEAVLNEQAPPSNDFPCHEATPVFDMPALTVDGMPTTLFKMTQSQLRTFIPEMMRHSTGRCKPGWGKVECRPPWWPPNVPWANIRLDCRDEASKQSVSWTDVLRCIIISCYSYHGRDDLVYDPYYSDQFLKFQSYHSAVADHSNNSPAAVMMQPQQAMPEGAAAIINALQTSAVSAGQASFSDWSLVELEGGDMAAEDSSHHQSVQLIQIVNGSQPQIVQLPCAVVKSSTATTAHSHKDDHVIELSSGAVKQITTVAESPLLQEKSDVNKAEPILIASGDWSLEPFSNYIALPASIFHSLVTGVNQSGEGLSVVSEDGYQIISVDAEGGGACEDHVIKTDVAIGGNSETNAPMGEQEDGMDNMNDSSNDNNNDDGR